MSLSIGTGRRRRGPTNISRFSILFRMIVLSAVLLAVLAASVAYLGRQIAHDADSLEQQTRLLSTVTSANTANKAFGDLKYWLTDFAVSLLMRAQLRAEEARVALNAELDELGPYYPETVAAVHREVDALVEKAMRAVDAYARDERVLGNSIMAEARVHIRSGEERLQSLVQSLESQAYDKRDTALQRAQQAVNISSIIAICAIVFGLTLTWFVIRSIRSTLAERDRYAMERAHAREALVEREKHLDAIVTTVADAIITIDQGGIIRTFNPAASRMFGCQVEDAIGQNISMLMSDADRGLHDEYLHGDVETGEARMIGRTREVTGRRKDGNLFPLHLSVSTMEVGGQRLFAGILRDISDLKRRERELLVARDEAEVASRAKTEFLTNMSHELRTPLNAIIGFSDIMKAQMMGPLGADCYREYCEDIYNSGTHLLQMINDILDMSKIEAGEMQLRESDIDVDAVTASCLRLINERAQKLGVVVSRELGDSHGSALYGDERMFKQMLLNLLSNAVKFTPRDGRVVLRGGIDETGAWSFAIADTGIGIAPEDIELVMSPFRQVDSRLQRKFEGTGLGLPLVKSIIELHGGTLRIESEVDVGTTCTIAFPTGRTHHRAVAAERKKAG